MRLGLAMVGTALVLAACSPGRTLPPEQNSLAKRLQPRPQRALIYVHGDAQRPRGKGTLLLVSANAPASQPMARGLPPGPGMAKLKVFNDTFSLIDAPEGVVTVIVGVAPADDGSSEPLRISGDPLALSIAPGQKYYVRVNEAGPPERPRFTVESVPDGERALAPALLGGYVRLNDAAVPPPTALHAP
jgi:hypothetical protein